MRLTLFIFFVFLNLKQSHAQSYNFSFTNYVTTNGLPFNSISCIIQDKNGFLWIGTSEGLSRYDGKNFKNYFTVNSHNQNFGSNSFYCLKEYKPDNLLFSSDGKLNGFNSKTNLFYPFTYFKSKTVYSVQETFNNGYLMGAVDTCFVTDADINLLDYIAPPFNVKNRPISGYEIKKDLWLVGNDTEYFLYDPQIKKLRYFPLKSMIGATATKNDLYYFKYFDAENEELYFSNFFTGIYKFSLDGLLLYHYKISADNIGLSNSNISFINKKNDSIFWIGTLGGGLHILNKKTNLFFKVSKNIFNGNSLPDDNVVANYTDNDKNEWIATSKGLAKINNSQNIFTEVQSESPILKTQNFLNIKKGVDGQIYVSCLQDNKIYKVSNNQKLLPIKNVETASNWCLNNFEKKMICTGSGSGITIFDPTTLQYKKTDFLKKYFPLSDVIILALKQTNGDEWYSGNNGGGFVRVKAADKKIYQYKKENSSGNFSNSYYSCYVEDKNNDLWFGVDKSSRLLHWDSKEEKFDETYLDDIKNISGENFKGINDLAIDEKQNLWIAFDGNGIVCYNKNNKTAEHYSISNGLSTNYISALQFDNNKRLWIGSLKGLSCFYLDQKKFVNFSKEDGLPDDNFTEKCIFFDSIQNKLWVGTNNSLFYFDPNKLLENNRKTLPIYIDRLVINGKNYTEEFVTKNTLQPTDNNIQFYFIAVNINKGKDIEYSYKLSEADKDWVFNGDITNASFANLNPGKYTFNVRARNRGDNVWNTLQTPLNFFIAPYWWQTWFFNILAALAAITLIFVLFRVYFKSRLQKEKNLMEKELAIEQERNRMARDLHDGLGSMLSGIKHSFSAIKNELNSEGKIQNKFDSNIEKLDESITELRNISHSITSEMFLKHGLENSIQDYCNTISHRGSIAVSFKGIDLENIVLNQDQAFHIFRIIQELLQNTCKHADATNALVQLSYHLKKLYITVEDNGKGYDKATIKNKDGIGLKNVEARVKILKGKIDVKSAKDDGTSVFIEISISKKN